MSGIKHLQNIAAGLAAPTTPKANLSIEDQVRIDRLLYNVGETIRRLLHESELYDPWAPECTLASPDAPPVHAYDAKETANELSSKVYGVLLDVRYQRSRPGTRPRPSVSTSA